MHTNNEWTELCDKIKQQFNLNAGINGVLFLIGIREMQFPLNNFNQAERLDLINLGCCTLLGAKGYCTKEGEDGAGWPIWEKTDKLSTISEEQKEEILKNEAINYFKDIL